ncbi:NAD(P)-dependent oxidoreductase [Ramlibacter sp. G-1-2-2]|uniref:NAD(P)-dependent oxidoreductase n=1 Tax=Ramlibacter agri TaxID=2728837 RepID=A0A848HIA4_9BURK|nr:NAD(P)-dependent oxidoreductase [Ramlibacter agri]NML47428.1 NAD(P)-dependent oxidoreductase [Ramlibacter agri]
MSGIVGVVGLGNMGRGIASRLLETGHKLVVFDVRPQAQREFAERGATIAGSPRAVADEAAVVLVSLPTPDVVKQVALGADGLVQGRAIKTYIDFSTTGPQVAREVGEALAQAGIQAIDAPVTGAVTGAATGKLQMMLSGDRATIAAVTPVLQHLGHCEVVGDRVGMGQSLKLLNNLMVATAMAITAEATVLGVKAGLDPDVMLRVLNRGSGRNICTEERWHKHVLNRKFDNGFANGLMRKDVRLCMDMAESLQVPMWVATAVDRLWMQTVLQVGAEQNTTTIVQTLEQWAGVEVRGNAA